MSERVRGPRIHRPPASATWECEHRWGHQIGDVTSHRVTRSARGHLTISVGNNSVEVRPEMVEHIARMVAEAAVWTDERVLAARAETTTSEESADV